MLRTLGLLALCLALAAGLAFLFFQPAATEDALDRERAEVQQAPDVDTRLPVVPAADGAPPTPATTSERESVPAELARPIAGELGGFTFVGPLVLPDRSSLRLSHVRAELRPETGEALLFEGEDVEALVFEGVQRASYELRVEAAGHTHWPESFDFSEARPDARSRSASVSERVTLWPEGWIPVVVLASDGRPFRELAAELGWEPKNLFVHAFEVRVSSVLAVAGDPLPPLDPELATWRPAPGYQNVELPGSVAGSLQLHAPPPLWIGLWVHGRVHEGRVLNPGDGRIVFGVDLAALEAGMASVSCTLVDRDSRAPVIDASATLKADTSAHRRGDLSDQAPDQAGVLRFARVIPGQHELTILRAGQIVQRRLELAPGQALDLGPVEIGSGPGLPVRVIDREGRPVPAWVEIAPYERGRYVEELYPPNLHRMTDDGGLYELPVPDRVFILRVRPSRLDGHDLQYSNIGSRNYRIDPTQLPAELVVIAEERVDLRVEPRTPWVAGQRVTFEDEHGLVVDLAGGESKGELDADLVPGSYTARRWDGTQELGTLAVDVAAGQRIVACP